MKEAKVYRSQKINYKSGSIGWRPRYVVFDKDGVKQVKNGKVQKTKAEADRFSKKIVDDLNTRDSLKLVTKEDAMTVGEFALTHWLKAERQVSVVNKAQINASIKFWKEIGLWDIKLEDITSSMMYKYLKRLKDRGLKPASIQNYKTELRTLLDLARTMNQINANPLTDVKLERRTQEQQERDERIFNEMRDETWSLEEIHTNLEKLRHIPKTRVEVTRDTGTHIEMRNSTGNIPPITWYGRFCLGFYLGLRTGELMALKFSDFDFINKEVVINKAISKKASNNENGEITGWVYDESKVKSSSQRIQSCPDAVIDYVQQLAVELDLLGVYHEDQYLFVNKFGHLINLDYFRKNFIRIQELVGIERPLKSPKYTRHTSATVLAGLGWSSTDIANHLGHKNDRVTREYYIKEDMDLKKRMADSFDKGYKPEQD
jgi:integrase|tara:strand:+ start:189 stop:1481 length:1293 start_codon:yes stop_codon:yes gene_type:complete